MSRSKEPANLVAIRFTHMIGSGAFAQHKEALTLDLLQELAAKILSTESGQGAKSHQSLYHGYQSFCRCHGLNYSKT
jgi:hypothetical protein